MNKRLAGLVLLTSLASMDGASARAASAVQDAGTGGFERALSLEFKDIPAGELFRLLGEFSRREIRVDPSVAGMKVTLKFANVPVQMVLDGVALQLGLRYRYEGDVLRVEPRGEGSSIGDASEVGRLQARIEALERELDQLRAGCRTR